MPDAPPQTMIRSSRWDPRPIRHISTPKLSVTLFGSCLSNDQAVVDATTTSATARQAVRALVNLPGRFGVAVSDGDVLSVAGDFPGTIRWWWTHHKGRVHLSLSPLPLAQMKGQRIDPVRLAAGLFLPDVAPDLSDESIYYGVRELSPSRVLVVSGDRVTTEQRPELPHVPLADAPDALAAALITSVRARTTGASSVSADLSGGLDSSTLAILAARDADKPVTALTYTDPYATNDDDTGYAYRIAEAEPGLDQRMLTGGRRELPFSGLDEMPFTDLPTLDTPIFTRTRFRLAPAVGTSVHLVGDAGDVVLGAPITYLADLARPATARRFLSECTAWARLRHRPVHRLVRAAFATSRMTYRAALSNAADKLEAAPGPHRTEHVPDFEASISWFDTGKSARWATPAARAQVAEALRAYRAEGSPERADDHAFRLIRWHGTATRSFLHVAEHLGVQAAVPFFDSDVLTACLSVPASLRASARQAKPILGQAFADQLPPELFNRRTKGDYSVCEYHGLRANARQVRALMTDSRLADLGVIEPAAVRADLEAAISGARAPMGALSQLLATEVWLRALETNTGDL